MSNYSTKDIEVLDMDIDRVQKFPHLYIPDKRLGGAVHLVREIKDNSDDEIENCTEYNNKLKKAGKKYSEVDPVVTVTFTDETKDICVEDHGRGIPHEDMRQLCEVLHSSGKFSKGKDSAYNKAGGMHRQYCALQEVTLD
jgi:DNA gyrase/topoisomerase IV subunit B